MKLQKCLMISLLISLPSFLYSMDEREEIEWLQQVERHNNAPILSLPKKMDEHDARSLIAWMHVVKWCADSERKITGARTFHIKSTHPKFFDELDPYQDEDQAKREVVCNKAASRVFEIVKRN